MSSEQRSFYILLCITIIGTFVTVIYASINPNFDIIPLFNLPTVYHFYLLSFVVPIVGCIITAVILPRIIAPIFLRLKKLTMSKYIDAYVEITPQPLSLRKWIGRTLLTTLLLLGLIAVVVQILDPALFMTTELYNELVGYGLAKYAPPLTISIGGLLVPIAFGMLAAAWAMEDAGLMHYYIPEEEDRLYEVEPTHMRYTTYLKGYAGLSSLLFIISIIYQFMVVGGNIENAFVTILLPFFAIIQTIPGYLVYMKMGSQYLKKGLPVIDKIDESNLRLQDIKESL